MKKRGRKIKDLLPEPRSTDLSALLHFRLCHVCLYLNESGDEISDCKKCGEPFVRRHDQSDEEDIQAVTQPQHDPFEDWDQDDEEVEVQVESDDDESSYHEDDNKRLNGLRVRW